MISVKVRPQATGDCSKRLAKKLEEVIEDAIVTDGMDAVSEKFRRLKTGEVNVIEIGGLEIKMAPFIDKDTIH